MNNFIKKHDVNGWEDFETAWFNVTLSITPFIPYSVYFCYNLPAKTQLAWETHYKSFVNFKDFQYAFMQNMLGNILSFMDIYEKTALAAEYNDYITVVEEFGRAIRRIIIFTSMLGESAGDDVYM